MVIYMFPMFYFFHFQKVVNKRLRKANWPTFCNIFFCLFLLKVWSVGPVDQQIDHVLS